MNVDFFIQNSYEVSKLITKKYSTSFSLAISMLNKEKRRAIYAIYGLVRLADEIVDSFHGHDKAFLLKKLDRDLKYALDNNISTNTLVIAFADTVNNYNINKKHINAFMNSMKYDLAKTDYSNHIDFKRYIYGSADVVGLMCLRIFCDGQQPLYKTLEAPAMRLGSAFQKVNFLRDLKNDALKLGRSYFPEITTSKFDRKSKKNIEASIKNDFDAALIGVRQLPGRSKLAVALAYYYYLCLFNKIKRTSYKKVLTKRIRISNIKKFSILLKVYVLYKIKLI